jgi:hypothetical protein
MQILLAQHRVALQPAQAAASSATARVCASPSCVAIVLRSLSLAARAAEVCASAADVRAC